MITSTSDPGLIKPQSKNDVTSVDYGFRGAHKIASQSVPVLSKYLQHLPSNRKKYVPLRIQG